MHEVIYMLYGLRVYCYLKDILLAANANLPSNVLICQACLGTKYLACLKEHFLRP